MDTMKKIIDKVILNWRTLLTFSLLAFVAVGAESCSGKIKQEMTVVAKNVACNATSIGSNGRVVVNCSGSKDSFRSSSIAISLLQKPQSLVCTLHKAKGKADCTLKS